MPQNLYFTLDALKRSLKVTKTDASRDAALLDTLEQASRDVDGECRQHFYTMNDTRYSDTSRDASEVLIDTAQSISALTTDSEGDGTYDGETWVEDTDFWLWPDNKPHKMSFRLIDFGNYSFPRNARRYFKAVGLFGYGDGVGAPWKEVAGVTLTVADDSGLVFTASADPTSLGRFEIGQTLLIEDEQAGIVTATASNGTKTVTVERRGVNGTTAAAHTAKAASVALYPPAAVKTVRQLVIADENTRITGGFKTSEADGHGFTSAEQQQKLLQRWLGPITRLEVA